MNEVDLRVYETAQHGIKQRIGGINATLPEAGLPVAGSLERTNPRVPSLIVLPKMVKFHKNIFR